MSKSYGQGCPVAKSLDLLGERWTLLIARDLLRKRNRFQDLLTNLQGLAPNILSDRLKLMEEHGLVERRFYSDHPPRAEYILTEKGQDLAVVIAALADWGWEHLEAKTALVHKECGHPVEVTVSCPHCDQGLGPDAVRFRPVPR